MMSGIKQRYGKIKKNVKSLAGNNGLGIISLVTGLFGVVSFLEGFIGIGFSVVAIMLSILQGNRFPSKAGGWGMIFGTVGIILAFIAFVFRGWII